MNKKVLLNKINPLIKMYKMVVKKLFNEDHCAQIIADLYDFSLEKRTSL